MLNKTNLDDLPKQSDFSIISIKEFIQATRDSGYKGTTNAVCELIDNSIQASAKIIHIQIIKTQEPEDLWPIKLAVVDDGTGMGSAILRSSLRFGGTTRFNDRSSMGRFGMGLPNSSVSQSRLVEVYSWQKRSDPLMTYLSIDEIVQGEFSEIPHPEIHELPPWIEQFDSESGTAVIWGICDRLDHKLPSTIARKLAAECGRIYRHYLWEGLQININGERVHPFDPLYLHHQSPYNEAEQFQSDLGFEFRIPNRKRKTTFVTVTFSELPIEKWHTFSTKEKRQMQITKKSGVSIVRDGREIDYGWFFMGSKRRENYDDWWRCEIKFEPCLDDLFGITHTKQQIKPSESLVSSLSDSLEPIARALSARVRERHKQLALKARSQPTIETAEIVESTLDCSLTPSGDKSDAKLFHRLKKRKLIVSDSQIKQTTFGIIEEKAFDEAFMRSLVSEMGIYSILNRDHRFFKEIYSPITEQTNDQLSKRMQLFMLAATRAEASFKDSEKRKVIREFLEQWGYILSKYLDESC